MPVPRACAQSWTAGGATSMPLVMSRHALGDEQVSRFFWGRMRTRQIARMIQENKEQWSQRRSGRGPLLDVHSRTWHPSSFLFFSSRRH
eukprot:scaffold86160_cov19-Tisochrysis_lutea.AAC.1